MRKRISLFRVRLERLDPKHGTEVARVLDGAANSSTLDGNRFIAVCFVRETNFFRDTKFYNPAAFVMFTRNRSRRR